MEGRLVDVSNCTRTLRLRTGQRALERKRSDDPTPGISLVIRQFGSQGQWRSPEPYGLFRRSVKKTGRSSSSILKRRSCRRSRKAVRLNSCHFNGEGPPLTAFHDPRRFTWLRHCESRRSETDHSVCPRPRTNLRPARSADRATGVDWPILEVSGIQAWMVNGVAGRRSYRQRSASGIPRRHGMAFRPSVRLRVPPASTRTQEQTRDSLVLRYRLSREGAQVAPPVGNLHIRFPATLDLLFGDSPPSERFVEPSRRVAG